MGFLCQKCWFTGVRIFSEDFSKGYIVKPAIDSITVDKKEKNARSAIKSRMRSSPSGTFLSNPRDCAIAIPTIPNAIIKNDAILTKPVSAATIGMISVLSICSRDLNSFLTGSLLYSGDKTFLSRNTASVASPDIAVDIRFVLLASDSPKPRSDAVCGWLSSCLLLLLKNSNVAFIAASILFISLKSLIISCGVLCTATQCKFPFKVKSLVMQSVYTCGP